MSDDAVASSQRLIRDRFFSVLTARLLFFVLLLADIVWGIYAFFLFILLSVAALVTLLKVKSFKQVAATYWLSVKRACVCSVALFLALFSPGFGIMIACTYFLMYDKEGLEEVVPASLQSQFQDFFTATSTSQE
jgi:membrane protease YdiL (CAAX protease family)